MAADRGARAEADRGGVPETIWVEHFEPGVGTNENPLADVDMLHPFETNGGLNRGATAEPAKVATREQREELCVARVQNL